VKSKTEVLIFDIGNVLLDFDLAPIANGFAECSGRERDEIFSYIFRSGLSESFDRGEISEQEFYSSVTARFPMNLSYENFRRIACDIFTEKPAINSIIKSLKDHFELGILSNTNKMHFEHIQSAYPLMRHFKDYHLSYRLKLLKPDSEIYKQLINFYGTAPERIFYTDDILENVLSAREQGINAFHFKSAEQLVTDLKSAGIVFFERSLLNTRTS